MPQPIDIDADIRAAQTLPAWVYTDADAFAAQREIFASSWQLVGFDSELPADGSVAPKSFVPGLLDEPIVLTKSNGITRCLSNVCTHRGNRVVACPQSDQKHLTCGYHGRRFGLDGAFEHMPEFDGVVDFPRKVDSLRTWQLTRWGPLLFAAHSPQDGFDTLAGALRDRIDWLPADALSAPHEESTYTINAHWALYCDNYLEGFHIPYVHAGLNQAIEYSSYETCLDNQAVLQVGLARTEQAQFEPPASAPDAGKSVAAYYLWLFPNTLLNFYPWGLSINIVEPLAIDRTRVRYYSLFWDESLRDAGAGAGLDMVEAEDDAIVESVQAGVRSRSYVRGRYSPTRERGVHHFHRLLADELNARL